LNARFANAAGGRDVGCNRGGNLRKGQPVHARADEGLQFRVRWDEARPAGAERAAVIRG